MMLRMLPLTAPRTLQDVGFHMDRPYPDHDPDYRTLSRVIKGCKFDQVGLKGRRTVVARGLHESDASYTFEGRDGEQMNVKQCVPCRSPCSRFVNAAALTATPKSGLVPLPCTAGV